MFALPLTSNLALFLFLSLPFLFPSTFSQPSPPPPSPPPHVNYQLIPALTSGAFDGLYAEWRQLSAEAFIRGERWRRLVITTFWNAAVLMLAIVTPNITVAIEMLGK